MVGLPRLVGIGLLAWLVGPGWLVQVCWHRFVGHGWLAQPGWPRYVGWLAGFVGSKYFQTLSWYPGPGSPRIFEPIFFVGILGEPDQRYSLLTHDKNDIRWSIMISIKRGSIKVKTFYHLRIF